MKTRRFHSPATSPGIAIGRAHCLVHKGPNVQRLWLRDRDVETEIARFREAVDRSQTQLSRIQAKMCRIQGTDQIKIIESHRLFLKDDLLVGATLDHIRQAKINAEWALEKTLSQLKLSFMNVEGEYFRERRQDLDYVGRRLMDNLMGKSEFLLPDFSGEDMILIAHDLSPAEVANLPRDRVAGFIMEAGGETSHTGIIARAFELPALLGVQGILDDVTEGETIVLDGMKGLAIASPERRELEQYSSVRRKYAALDQLLLQDIHLPTEMRDGARIRLDANMELAAELPSLLQHGAEGVGLYRTEYLFLNRLDEPSEDEQFENYVQVLKQLSPRPVTIRTIDLGGDKLAIGQEYEKEDNPALGLRAIRLCLRERTLFRTQLRALLRASPYGQLRIMIPLISRLEEVREVKKIIADIRQELQRKHIKVRASLPLGVMIEVPSAVLMAAELAAEVDFFSIGTNDLLQYGMAIDRGNELVNHLFTPYHPALLRMIAMTVAGAKRRKLPVSICGEVAADPLAIAFLAGLDLEALSMNPVSIPRVKKILRALKKSDSVKLVGRILKLTTAQEVERMLRSHASKVMPAAVKKLSVLAEGTGSH